MQVAVKKWGNSQGIILSKDVLSLLDAQVGDSLDIQISDGRLIATKTFKHKTLEERIAESGVPLSPIPEIDWGESRGNEIW